MLGGGQALNPRRRKTIRRQCPARSAGNNAWTLPFGDGAGRVVKIGGKLPVNISLSALYNALRPEFGSTWQLSTQLVFIF
jgi:hypothetical protein